MIPNGKNQIFLVKNSYYSSTKTKKLSKKQKQHNQFQSSTQTYENKVQQYLSQRKIERNINNKNSMRNIREKNVPVRRKKAEIYHAQEKIDIKLVKQRK